MINRFLALIVLIQLGFGADLPEEGKGSEECRSTPKGIIFEHVKKSSLKVFVSLQGASISQVASPFLNLRRNLYYSRVSQLMEAAQLNSLPPLAPTYNLKSFNVYPEEDLHITLGWFHIVPLSLYGQQFTVCDTVTAKIAAVNKTFQDKISPLKYKIDKIVHAKLIAIEKDKIDIKEYKPLPIYLALLEEVKNLVCGLDLGSFFDAKRITMQKYGFLVQKISSLLPGFSEEEIGFEEMFISSQLKCQQLLSPYGLDLAYNANNV